ncbi:hypothetical protein BDQ17DRAFT_1334301 [Cyathus striatus]|nr:hypothetical protein BDQ17DRAFT_1334301 [Cyathus striatus]
MTSCKKSKKAQYADKENTNTQHARGNKRWSDPNLYHLTNLLLTKIEENIQYHCTIANSIKACASSLARGWLRRGIKIKYNCTGVANSSTPLDMSIHLQGTVMGDPPASVDECEGEVDRGYVEKEGNTEDVPVSESLETLVPQQSPVWEGLNIDHALDNDFSDHQLTDSSPPPADTATTPSKPTQHPLKTSTPGALVYSLHASVHALLHVLFLAKYTDITDTSITGVECWGTCGFLHDGHITQERHMVILGYSRDCAIAMHCGIWWDQWHQEPSSPKYFLEAI